MEDNGNMAKSINDLIFYCKMMFDNESVVLEELNPLNLNFT